MKVASDFAKYVTSDVFMAMTTKTVISEESGDFFSTIKDRGNTFLRNFGKLLSDYTASHTEKKVFVSLE